VLQAYSTILASSHEGNLVLDPFCGSGTTGVAALALGRRFIGIEREEAFLTLARRRIKDQVIQGRLAL
jgi:DNA modification methylase